MAKKENQVDVFGGLSFGTKVNDNNDIKVPEVKVEPEVTIGPTNDQDTELKPRNNGLDATVPADVEIGAEKTKKAPKAKTSDVRDQLVKDYKRKYRGKNELLTARIQIATTPTIKETLKELEANGEIKSMNHLINNLLEKYLGFDQE